MMLFSGGEVRKSSKEKLKARQTTMRRKSAKRPHLRWVRATKKTPRRFCGSKRVDSERRRSRYIRYKKGYSSSPIK